jgi:serine/threonine-protein kinase
MPNTQPKKIVPAPTKFGRYEIAAEIGSGSMGKVYKAFDPLIERTVALKTIRMDTKGEQQSEFEARFFREAKSAGRLNHPNIVTIYDVGESGDNAYIAMEYLHGESLDKVLAKHAALPLERTVHIALQVANGLAYAHQHGVVHRDIKPGNVILLRRGGVVKITDFGIAQILSGSQTQVGALLGSPRYMSPEQVQGTAIDGRSDVFSLGVMLYEMLTGVTPFAGDNLSAIFYAIMNHDPAPPSSINPALSPAHDRIVMRALAKRPHERYANAREIATDLRALHAVEKPPAKKPALNRAGEATALRAQTRNADKALLRSLLTMISIGVALIAVLIAVVVLVTSNTPTTTNSLQSKSLAQKPLMDKQPAAVPQAKPPVEPRITITDTPPKPRPAPHPNRVAIAALDKKLQALKIKRAELLLKYTELYPDVVITTQQIKRLEREKRKLQQEK